MSATSYLLLVHLSVPCHVPEATQRELPPVWNRFLNHLENKQLVKFCLFPLPERRSTARTSFRDAGYKSCHFCRSPQNTQFLNSAEVILPPYLTAVSYTDERYGQSELPSSSPTLGTVMLMGPLGASMGSTLPMTVLFPDPAIPTSAHAVQRSRRNYYSSPSPKNCCTWGIFFPPFC